MHNSFGLSILVDKLTYRRCTYKDINNQISVLDCNEMLLTSYICQKSLIFFISLKLYKKYVIFKLLEGKYDIARNYKSKLF
jgi:hypothetical protein